MGQQAYGTVKAGVAVATKGVAAVGDAAVLAGSLGAAHVVSGATGGLVNLTSTAYNRTSNLNYAKSVGNTQSQATLSDSLCYKDCQGKDTKTTSGYSCSPPGVFSKSYKREIYGAVTKPTTGRKSRRSKSKAKAKRRSKSKAKRRSTRK